jgi:hypothetical protein
MQKHKFADFEIHHQAASGGSPKAAFVPTSPVASLFSAFHEPQLC